MHKGLALVLVLLLAAKQMDVTPEELQIERQYRIAERLGILSEGKPVTMDQIEIAEREADEWRKKMTNEN